MVSLRWRIIGLLLWLALLFNIERVNLGSEDTVNLPTATYVAALVVAVGALLPFGSLRNRATLVALAVGTYAIALFLAPGPGFGGVRFYLALAGLLLVLITTALAYLATEGLDEFHHGVETVALANAGPRLPSLDEAGDRIEVELDRTRRIERPLSVVKLRIDSAAQSMLVHRFVAEITHSLVRRYATAAVARVTTGCIRRNNFVVADDEQGQLLIVAPETSTEQVPVLAERVGRCISAQFGFTPQIAYATLPTDALTFADLRAVVEGRLVGTPARPAHGLTELQQAEPQGATD
jgi:hypothetical protein